MTSNDYTQISWVIGMALGVLCFVVIGICVQISDRRSHRLEQRSLQKLCQQQIRRREKERNV